VVNLCTEFDSVDPATKPPIDWFFKSPESVTGPAGSIVLPPHYASAFYVEPEVAVVIGKRCHDVPADEAESVIFGYTAILDGSAVGLGRVTAGTYFGKSFDSFCPMGPAILVRDPAQDVRSFEVQMRLNGERVTRYTIGDLPHSIGELIADVSGYNILLPGDVVGCGSPPGERFQIAHGDVVEAEIAGIGRMSMSVEDPLFRHRVRVG
jgi:2-keto-4-pentenoate hydratase/2-oxohepta-3-ene-1,7-dioic acid hydratase in catechol pathway